MNLLGTHDTERILTILGGQQRGSRSNSELAVYRMDEQTRNLAINRLKTSYTLLSTLPGIPTVFYGDEVGLEGFGDPFNRMPYPWDKENEDLLSHYRRLGKIRRDNTVYGAGGFKLLHLDDQLLIFKRYDSRNDYVTVVNNAPFDLELSFECSACSLLKGISATTHLLPGNCAEVYKLKRGATLEIN
jgi:glycosidase